MRDGVDVVYQGVLASDGWRGQADFLMRVETPSALGAWSYEALDTKLARHAKPAYILQLCFYSEQLARIQGREPAHIHVLLGNQEQATLHAAGVRRLLPARLPAARGVRRRPAADRAVPVRRTAASATSSRSATRTGTRSTTSAASPASAAARSRGSRRAGSRRSPALGAAAAERGPPGIADDDVREAPRAGRAPARGARDRAGPLRASCSRTPASGFALLPDPSPGDLFFDFEGNPFWDAEGSLEYLWGILDRDDEFEPLWATTARRSRRRSRRSSTSCTSGSPRTRTCTSTTTRSTRSRRCAA